MNYTLLKTRLMQHGAVFTPSARKMLPKDKFGHINFDDYATTGGMIVEIDGWVYANVPIMFGGTPFYIEWTNNHFFLLDKNCNSNNIVPVNVRVIPQPQYALDNKLLQNDIPVRELIMTHGDRARIMPIHGCAFHCQFCTCNLRNYMEIPLEQIDEAIQVAINDPYIKPRHFLISGGTPENDENSFSYIDSVYRYFPRKYSKYDFDVMLAPRGMKPGEQFSSSYNDFLHYLFEDCGIKTLSVNIEMYNDSIRREYITDKWKIGIKNYLTFIEQAVRIFGEGTIRSSIIVGLEPKEDTLEAVRQICLVGGIPTLSAFVAAPGTLMARYPEPSVEYLYEIAQESNKIARANGMFLGPKCRMCSHNSITFEDSRC